MGGGDVKMIAALATWFAPQQLILFILWVLMCGGVIGAIYLSLIAIKLLLERFVPKAPLPTIDPKAGMAYGLATACGFAVSAW
ncbi:prepilin peptidase, partial [Acinetobacter baumannii]